MFKKVFDNNGAFFRQDENGHFVFYPWGRPGRGFVVSERQRKQITMSASFMSFLFVCIAYVGFFKYDAGSIIVAIWLWSSSIVVYATAYAIYVMSFIKTNKLTTMSLPKEKGFPAVCKLLIVILSVESVILLLGINIYPDFYGFKLMYAAVGMVCITSCIYSFYLSKRVV
jgi:hypothetical protein